MYEWLEGIKNHEKVQIQNIEQYMHGHTQRKKDIF